MKNILNQFQKVDPWKFRSLLESQSLSLKVLQDNTWQPLKSWSGNFEAFHKPIFLYEKINGEMKINAVGLYMKL